jgi:leader peptidase (prepilin peptidase)/N-methyltransferase
MHAQQWSGWALGLIALVGLVVGSFLNVVAHRIPLGRSVVRPGSACPRCEHHLSWWENLPVVSWVLLRGKCRTCHTPISPQYLLVEVITAAVAVAVAILVGRDPIVITWWIVVAFGVPLAVIDLHTHRLPVVIMYPAVGATAMSLALTAALTSQWSHLGRAAGAGLGLAAVIFALWWVTAGRGMGWGDVRLAWLLGMPLGWMGWPQVIIGGWLGFFSGGLLGALLLLLGRSSRKSPIPFGPHFMLGALAGLAWGPALADWITGRTVV